MGILTNLGKRKSAQGQGGVPRLKLHGARDRAPVEAEEENELVLSNNDDFAQQRPEPAEIEIDEIPSESEMVSMISGEPAAAVGSEQIAEPPRQWGLEVLQTIDWKRFEELCQQIFVRRGFNAEPAAAGAERGIDLVAHRDSDEDGPGVAIACRRCSYPVPAKEVREFFGAVLRAGHAEAIFIATTGFNQAAHDEFGSDQRLQLVDGEKLLRVIDKLGEDAAGELLELVTEDRDGWTTPTCPQCEAKMTLNHNGDTGREYWECANYAKTGCLQRFYC